MVAAFVAWGFRAADPLWLWVVLGIGAPALAVFAWGTLIAPRAPRRLDDPARLVAEVALFGLAAAALVLAGLPIWGVALAVIAVINIAILQALGPR